MKKMIALLSLFAVTSAFPAMVQWASAPGNYITGPDNSVLSSGTGYLVYGTTAEDIKSNVGAFSTFADEFAVDRQSIVDGELYSLETDNGYYKPVFTISANVTTDFFIVLFDDDNSHYLLSDAVEVDLYTALPDTQAQATLEFTLASYFTENEWTSTSVPEPTVLALLALGVAGMALKRKVA